MECVAVNHGESDDHLGRLDLAAEHLASGALNYRSDFDYDRYGNRYRPAQGTQNPNLYYTPVETSDISPTTNRFTTPAHTPVAIGGNPHELKRMVEREATTHEKSMMLVEN